MEPFSAAPESSSPHTSQHGPRRLKVLVLVGLVGSGKSTFAKALSRYDSTYTRSSQDVLGSRQAVESHLLHLLSRGQNVIIDRTNVTSNQRETWLRLSLQWQEKEKRLKGNPERSEEEEEEEVKVEVEVDAIYFQTDQDECARRLMVRQDHETIHSPQEGVRILNIFASELKPPEISEGFHKILVLTPQDLPSESPSVEEVKRVMERLEAMPAGFTGGTRGALQPRTDTRGTRGRGGAAVRRGYGRGAVEGSPGVRRGTPRGRGTGIIQNRKVMLPPAWDHSPAAGPPPPPASM